MHPVEPGMDFFDALVRSEVNLWNHLDDHIRTLGLSLGTLEGLRVVRRHPGTCRVQEIRTDLGITVGAASKVVDRLERDGLAVRSAHPHDRRSSLVTLTPAGHEAHDRGVAALQAALDAVLADEPDLAVVTAALQRLRTRLQPTAGPTQ